MINHLPLHTLSQWQKVAFCAALLERMLPNYDLFTQASEFGDTKILRNQVDLIWQWLDKNNRCKINYQAQLVKLEDQVPDPEHFDTFSVFSAIDTCMALMSLLQAMSDKEANDYVNVSRLSENSVSAYVELILAQDHEEMTIAMIEEHPLMQWEQDTQYELVDFLTSAPENKGTCQKIRASVLEEGISSLGFEI